ncbi:MAG TPA: hypothetical protein PKY44_00640 [Bacteroidales bacterium]|jgi:hypothetical protein|nr:hypothetical protein [Bacteroidales bacterium]
MKESLYDITISRKNNLRNTGGDIQGKIFKQTLSPFILQDPRYKNILLKIEDIFYFLISKTRYIKIFFNYTVKKNYKYIN